MATLVKIGNSHGIRIPKPLIAKAQLENVELELEVVKDGLLIQPILTPKRANWKEQIEDTLLKNKHISDEAVIDELLDDSDLEDYQW